MPARRHPQSRLGAAACVALAVIGLAAAHPLRAPGAPAKPPKSAGEAPSSGACKAGKKGKESKAERKRCLRDLARKNRRQKKPNVIVVMTDDQDNSMVGLDSTARLVGSRGTTFTNSYVSFPLCCPARATFLNGQYAHNHGVTSTELPNGYGAFNKTNNLAIWLRRAGYRTGMVGKYLNGYGINDAKEVPPGWSEWFALTRDSDQRRYRYKLNEDGRIVKYKSSPEDYVTDVLGDKAVDFLRRNAPRPKPFFLWFNPTAPHGEAGRPFGSPRNPNPAPRHLGAFEGAIRPRTPNFNEEDVSDKPAQVRTLPKLSEAEILDIDIRYRSRVESLLSVDDAVKRLFTRLRKARDLGKTYVIFTSDNGLMMGAHRLLLKNHLYEEDTRVPLMIRGPRIPQGVARDEPVSNVDLAPTIVELTGATPGLTMDGRSLLPAANGAGGAREILFEAGSGDAGIRSGNWIYIDRRTETELYDLGSDPYQLQSLDANPSFNAIEAQLKARLAQIRFCAGASCP